MNCKNCGEPLEGNEKFCAKCGQKISKENEKESIDFKMDTEYNNYINKNNYKEQTKNPIAAKIILGVVIVIAFLGTGIFLGKLLFGEKVDKKDNTVTSILDSLNTVNTTTIKENNKANKTNTNTNIPNNNTQNVNLENSNYIVTYSGKKVFFNVVNTLIESSEVSDEKFRILEREEEFDDYLTIYISEDYGTTDEYMEDLEEDANRSASNSEYSNIQLSEVQTKIVNGREFKYRTYHYNYDGYEFKDFHIVCEIEEDSLYAIEIEEYQTLTEDELNGLLNITIL